jgi:hypothetical protein
MFSRKYFILPIERSSLASASSHACKPLAASLGKFILKNMKPLYLSILIVFTISCQERRDAIVKDNKNVGYEEVRNPETEIKFQNAKKNEIVINDTLLTHFTLKNLQELECKAKFLDKDFENEKSFIREYEIRISDTLLITALQRQGKGRLIDYAYFYKDKNFNKITNYHSEMFPRKANFLFHFDTKQAYRISKDKLLLRDQPSTWCGLANQMDFFQILDLKKMEMIQFVDYDSIVE